MQSVCASIALIFSFGLLKMTGFLDFVSILWASLIQRRVCSYDYCIYEPTPVPHAWPALQFIRKYTGKVDKLIKDKIEALNEVKAKEKEEKEVIAQQVVPLLT